MDKFKELKLSNFLPSSFFEARKDNRELPLTLTDLAATVIVSGSLHCQSEVTPLSFADTQQFSPRLRSWDISRWATGLQHASMIEVVVVTTEGSVSGDFDGVAIPTEGSISGSILL